MIKIQEIKQEYLEKLENEEWFEKPKGRKLKLLQNIETS